MGHVEANGSMLPMFRPGGRVGLKPPFREPLRPGDLDPKPDHGRVAIPPELKLPANPYTGRARESLEVENGRG